MLSAQRRQILAGVAMVVAATIAGWWLLRPGPDPVEASLPFAAPVTAAAPTASTSTPPGVTDPSDGVSAVGEASLVIHVAGEVNTPGLVRVGRGARIADVIEAAGGATIDAQIHALNLAAVVVDGQRVLVPHRDEVDVVAEPIGNPESETSDAVVVAINTATLEELQRLPGIGPALARAILTHREDHGAYGGPDDLLEVPGIGPAKLAGFVDLITW